MIILQIIRAMFHFCTFSYISVHFRSYAGIFVRIIDTNFHRCLPPKTDKIKHINNTYNFLTKKNQIEFGFELLNFQDKNIFQAVFLLLATMLVLDFRKCQFWIFGEFIAINCNQSLVFFTSSWCHQLGGKICSRYTSPTSRQF